MLRKKANNTRLFKQTMVTTRDINELKPREWLNDAIIDGFLKLVPKPNDASVLLTLEMQVRDGMTKSAKRLMKGKRYVYMPINVGNYHWIFVVVDRQKKTIQEYDSMHKHRKTLLKKVAKKLGGDISDWKFKETPDWYPKQVNGYSCGVFVCIGMWYLLTKRKIDYNQADLVKYGRTFIGRSILENTLRKDLKDALIVDIVDSDSGQQYNGQQDSAQEDSEQDNGDLFDDNNLEPAPVPARTPAPAPERAKGRRKKEINRHLKGNQTRKSTRLRRMQQGKPDYTGKGVRSQRRTSNVDATSRTKQIQSRKPNATGRRKRNTRQNKKR